MCTTFANSAPLPLVFADSLFANNPSMKADMTACISFYLLVWSPVFWTLGPMLLQSAQERLELVDVELDGSKNKETATNVPERRKLSGKFIISKILSPPVIGSILGVVVGTSSTLQAVFLQSDSIAEPVYGAAQTFASAYLPATILVLAGSMVTVESSNADGNERPAELFDDAGKPMPMASPNGNRQLSWRAILCIAAARFIVSPIITGTLLHFASTRTDLLGPPESRTTAVLVSLLSTLFVFADIVLQSLCV
jgi:predicted permease